MFTTWTKHISDPNEKERFERHIQSSKPVLDHLINLMDENEKSLDILELSEKDFDKPNWANKQAFRNGQRSVLRSMRKLINLDQQRDNT